MGSCVGKSQQQEKHRCNTPKNLKDSKNLESSIQLQSQVPAAQNQQRQRQSSNASKQSRTGQNEVPLAVSVRLQSPSIHSTLPVHSSCSLPPTPASRQPIILKQTKLMTNMNQSSNQSKFKPQKAREQSSSIREQLEGQQTLKFKQNLSKDYTMMDLISHGEGSVVYKLQHNKTQMIRAVKCIRKAHGRKTECQIHEVFTEIQLLYQFDHPNIVQIIDIYDDTKYYYIIEEFCNQGDLWKKITTIKHFDESQVAHIMIQIFNALAFIHSKHQSHQAIKPQNILFDENTLKLTDFGISQKINQSEGQSIDPLSFSSSSIPFMAPELLKEDENRSVNEKCDIWACGVIMFLLLSGRHPFSGQDKTSIIKSVLRGAFNLKSNEWECISDDAKDLITQCLQFSQKNRPSAAKCADHAWFKKNKGKTKQILKDTLNALQNLTAYKAIQQAAVLYIVRNLASNEEKERLQIAFQELDKNHDGQLSRQEILEGYKKIMGQHAAQIEVEKIFEILDKNHSNGIDYSEFVVATSNKTSLLTRPNLIKTFKTLDQDRSGYLSKKELKAFLIDSHFEGCNIDSMMDEMDKNMDGHISQKEFIEMMMKKPEEQI